MDNTELCDIANKLIWKTLFPNRSTAPILALWLVVGFTLRPLELFTPLYPLNRMEAAE
jgi:hypothetical protein